MQVVHTEFTKVILNRLFSLREVNQNDSKQAVAAVTVALISEKNKLKKKRLKVCMKPWLKRRKNLGIYETLLAELRLGDKYNWNILCTNDF